MSNTLIITLEMEPKYQQYFNAVRKQYFPSHANYLDAHITLFYHLPAGETSINDILATAAKRKELILTVEGLSNFGTGVAYRLVSDELQALHVTLQAAFEPWLVKQDRQPLRPHITIQNKVTAFKAQQLYEQLQEEFTPFDIKTVGFKTWLYLKGPWKAREYHAFSQ
jgi:2'-5' RNA ligase